MSRRARVIDRLRAVHGGAWIYCHHAGEWTQLETARRVAAFASWAPRFEWDDDHYTTSYRWTDTHELALWGFPLPEP